MTATAVPGKVIFTSTKDRLGRRGSGLARTVIQSIAEDSVRIIHLPPSSAEELLQAIKVGDRGSLSLDATLMTYAGSLDEGFTGELVVELTDYTVDAVFVSNDSVELAVSMSYGKVLKALEG